MPGSVGRIVLFQFVNDQAVLVQDEVTLNSHLEQCTSNSLTQNVTDRRVSPCLHLLGFMIPGHSINTLEDIYFEGQDREVMTAFNSL